VRNSNGWASITLPGRRVLSELFPEKRHKGKEDVLLLDAYIDRKKKARATIPIRELLSILQQLDKTDSELHLELHAVEPDRQWVTFRVQPDNKGVSSALVPGKPRMVRTSFYQPEVLKKNAQMLAYRLGFSYCEWIRTLEQGELDKWELVGTKPWRRRPQYVG